MSTPPLRPLFGVALSLVIACSGSGPTDPPPEPPGPSVALRALPESDAQDGVARYLLPVPLRVEVRVDGVLTEGVEVAWSTTSGSLSASPTRTDFRGQAIATWRLGADPGEVTATAVVAGAEGGPVTFSATVWEEVTAEVVAETNIQTGVVGAPTPRDLQVLVTTEGIPKAGVPVLWQTPDGTITASSLTGPDGVASADWTMPVSPGSAKATAVIRGRPGPPLVFVANVVAGTPVTLQRGIGDGQHAPLFVGEFSMLGVRALDSFGNSVSNAEVEWSLLQGTATVTCNCLTGVNGISTASVEPASVPGALLVQARLPTGSFVNFTLTVEQPARVVYLSTYNPIRFVSGWNGSSPAIDTIAVGETMIWEVMPFDYELHGVEPVGTPAFAGGEFPYGHMSELRRTLAMPGTYRYIDPHTGATGTLVVQ